NRGLHNEAMTVRRRALPSAALAALVLATAACASETPVGAGTREPAPTAVSPSSTAPTTASRGSTSTHTSSPNTTGSPTTAAATVPGPSTPLPTTPSPDSLEPLEPCPTAADLGFTFTAKKVGQHPSSGHDVVEVTVAYSNPRPYSLWLMASLGYIDPTGADQFLYYTPGGLPFVDEKMPSGAGTKVVQLEDPEGGSTGSEIYLSYWALAGRPFDSLATPPCEPSRGIHVPAP